MKLSLSSGLVDACSKCKKVRRLQRHHMGSEHMWLKWFANQMYTPRYIGYKARYDAFLPSDVVPLCDSCHRKVHKLYIEVIRLRAREADKPLQKWTWREAGELILELRSVCKKWLSRK